MRMLTVDPIYTTIRSRKCYSGCGYSWTVATAGSDTLWAKALGLWPHVLCSSSILLPLGSSWTPWAGWPSGTCPNLLLCELGCTPFAFLKDLPHDALPTWSQGGTLCPSSLSPSHSSPKNKTESLTLMEKNWCQVVFGAPAILVPVCEKGCVCTCVCLFCPCTWHTLCFVKCFLDYLYLDVISD